MSKPTHVEWVMSLFLVFSLTRLPAYGDDGLTTGGFTLSELIDCYTKNVKVVSSEGETLSVDRLTDGQMIHERVFYMQTYVLPSINNSLTNQSVLRIFASDSILHRVRIYSFVINTRKILALQDDVQAVEFLRDNAKVGSEGHLCDFMKAFAMARTYDVVWKRPKNIDRARLSNQPYSDAEWGLGCRWMQGELHGYMTVCTSVYSNTIYRYEFILRENGLVDLSNHILLYSGVSVR